MRLNHRSEEADTAKSSQRKRSRIVASDSRSSTRNEVRIELISSSAKPIKRTVGRQLNRGGKGEIDIADGHVLEVRLVFQKATSP